MQNIKRGQFELVEKPRGQFDKFVRFLKESIYKKKKIILIDFANSLLYNKKYVDMDTFELGVKISEEIVGKEIIPFIFGSEVNKRTSIRQYKGFDFLTKKGDRINVKSGVILEGWRWIFVLRYNDFNCSHYLCVGYEVNIEGYIFISHIWLIPSEKLDSRIKKRIIINDDNNEEFKKYDISRNEYYKNI